MDKIKISENEFYKKLCVGCAIPIYKDCKFFPNCGRAKLFDRFDVFEIIPEKSTLEEAREFYSFIQPKKSDAIKSGQCNDYTQAEIDQLKYLYEKAVEEKDKLIKELQEKLDKETN